MMNFQTEITNRLNDLIKLVADGVAAGEVDFDSSFLSHSFHVGPDLMRDMAFMRLSVVAIPVVSLDDLESAKALRVSKQGQIVKVIKGGRS